MKTIVCATKPSSFEDLKVKIINVNLGITINQLTNHLRDLQNHITLCKKGRSARSAKSRSAKSYYPDDEERLKLK